MKNSIITVGPTSEPVSILEAKQQLRILSDDTTFDVEISRKLTAARQWIERRYGISLISQTRKQTQAAFPCGKINLLYPPVQAITSFTYTDSNGATQTMVAGTNYSSAGLLTPVAGGSHDVVIPHLYPVSIWPVAKCIPDAIQIIYVAGYGSDGTYVPQAIKEQILKVLGHFFENRQADAELELSVDQGMAGYETFDHVAIDA